MGNLSIEILISSCQLHRSVNMLNKVDFAGEHFDKWLYKKATHIFSHQNMRSNAN